MSEPHSNSPFTAVLQLRQDVAVIRAAGELDLGFAPVLRERLFQVRELPEAPSALIVDLAGVFFCDSVGLGVLIAALRHSQATGLRLVLSGVHGTVERVLSLTGLSTAFEIHSNLNEALRAVGRSDR
ncbi:STAS domain-containing protein [Streptosporangium sp. DT93]|uniref:STAS domain-containing protein n=1 Tax=Streptosporangium sp. DT93 TaxID=3393428 RepID=UPI003CEA2CC4